MLSCAPQVWETLEKMVNLVYNGGEAVVRRARLDSVKAMRRYFKKGGEYQRALTQVNGPAMPSPTRAPARSIGLRARSVGPPPGV